jgi:ABC-type multidrug transport system permease subunit
MVGLNTEDGGRVVFHIFIAILTCLNGNSIGLMAGCAFNDIKAATSIIPLVLFPLILFSGFFANIKYFYVWIGWIQYLSPVKYSFEAIAINEFEGRHYEFGDPIATLGFDVGQWESVAILIGFVFVIRTCAYLFLRILRVKQ